MTGSVKARVEQAHDSPPQAQARDFPPEAKRSQPWAQAGPHPQVPLPQAPLAATPP